MAKSAAKKAAAKRAAAIAPVVQQVAQAAIAAATADPEPVTTYIVVHPVHYDDRYERDEEIDLDDDTAQQLLDLGVIKLKPEEAETK